ncbi:MAG: hypothetical protein QXJ98_03210 [Archaeoglobaceae archaeon]
MKLQILSILFLMLLATASAQELLVSDGGLLGIEGAYSKNLSEVYYGSTLFIQVSNVTTQQYAILVDGKSLGYNKAVYTVTKESGNITIGTSPETNTIEVTVKKQEDWTYWLAKYFVFAKSLPPIANIVFIDTVLYALLIIPIAAAIGLKLLVVILRAIL